MITNRTAAEAYRLLKDRLENDDYFPIREWAIVMQAPFVAVYKIDAESAEFIVMTEWRAPVCQYAPMFAVAHEVRRHMLEYIKEHGEDYDEGDLK